MFFRYRTGGKVPAEVAQGDGGADRPAPVQQDLQLELQGPRGQDGGVPGPPHRHPVPRQDREAGAGAVRGPGGPSRGLRRSSRNKGYISVYLYM